MEYAKYAASATGYVQRENADDEWVECSTAEARTAEDSLVAEKLAGARAAGEGRRGATIIRSTRNEEIAAQLGLTADEMAERLARPDQNQGTRRRISEEEFDAEMAKLGIDPKDARDRFAGRYWTRPEGPTQKIPATRLGVSRARAEELGQR